jgi:hypothetical protein
MGDAAVIGAPSHLHGMAHTVNAMMLIITV